MHAACCYSHILASLITSAITEVDEIMNGKDSVDHEDIDKMTYINSVLEETLRLYPVAPAVEKLNDQELTFGSYKIPKQSQVLVSINNLELAWWKKHNLVEATSCYNHTCNN